jgi:hypothetical protein
VKTKILFAVVCALLLTSQAWAATCVSGATLADYIALGSTGCTIGDKTFSNFALTTSQSGGATAPTAAGITITPVTTGGSTGNEIGLQFNALWTAGSNQTADTTINFDVAVTAGGSFLIDDASTVQSTSGFTGTGSASVTEGICANAGPSTCIPVTSTTTIKTSGTTVISDHVVFAPTGSIHAIKDIGVSGGTNGTASISQVVDSFSQTGVPEPASIFLMGSVMVGICGVIRRRRSQKA